MRQGLQCSEWGKPVPGLEPTKLSEPIWTLFFELHAGPWRTTGHDKRPDTRPIEAPSRTVAEKITLPNRGHPHTPRRDPRRRPESCASPNRSPKYELLTSARPPYGASTARLQHLTTLGGGGIHPISSGGGIEGLHIRAARRDVVYRDPRWNDEGIEPVGSSGRTDADRKTVGRSWNLRRRTRNNL